MHYNILPYASIEVLMQLTYYCRLYEASPYNMQIDRATFIALSFVKLKGLILTLKVTKFRIKLSSRYFRVVVRYHGFI